MLSDKFKGIAIKDLMPICLNEYDIPSMAMQYSGMLHCVISILSTLQGEYDTWKNPVVRVLADIEEDVQQVLDMYVDIAEGKI